MQRRVVIGAREHVRTVQRLQRLGAGARPVRHDFDNDRLEAAPGPKSQQAQARRKSTAIGLVTSAVACDLLVQPVQGGQRHRGMQPVEPDIQPFRIAPVTQPNQPIGQNRIVGGDITTLAAVQQLAGVQREALGGAEPADLAAGRVFKDALDGIEQQRQPGFLRQRHEAGHVAQTDNRMDGEQQPDLVGQCRAHGGGRGRKGRGIDLAEARPQPGPGRDIGHSAIGQRRHQHVRPARHRQCPDRQDQAPESVAKRDRMGGAMEGGQRLLQPRDDRCALIGGAGVAHQGVAVGCDQVRGRKRPRKPGEGGHDALSNRAS